MPLNRSNFKTCTLHLDLNGAWSQHGEVPVAHSSGGREYHIPPRRYSALTVTLAARVELQVRGMPGSLDEELLLQPLGQGYLLQILRAGLRCHHCGAARLGGLAVLEQLPEGPLGAFGGEGAGHVQPQRGLLA